MDAVEKGARHRHGANLYDLTWRARNEKDPSKKNRLWALLAIKVSATYLVIILMYYVGFEVYNQISSVNGYVWVVASILAVAFIEGFVSPHRSISNASSFYSIAADMKRTSQGGILPKLLLFYSGGMAVVLAMLVIIMSGRRLNKFSSTDLDVLGAVLSKAGRWGMVEKIYKEISMKYAGRFTKDDATRYQISVSFGLACKWMLNKPGLDEDKKVLFKSMMMGIVREYPQMTPEVAVRFQEVLGPRMDEALNPIKDARIR